MNQESSSYSPNILIYLEIDQRKIRLADVLYDSATLYEEVEASPGSRGHLVMEIDGSKESQEVILERGISKGDLKILFSYADASLLNGRLLTDFHTAV